MNHYVPDFEMDDDYSNPPSSGVGRPRKSPLPDDDIMELLWQNGQVVMQIQNQRSHRKSPPPSKYDAVIPADTEIRSSQGQGHESATHHHQQQQQQQQHLFMQEDEMASWLHYPLVDDPSLDHNFCGADLLYPASTCANSTSSDARPATTPPVSASASKPPIPPARTEMDSKEQNFVLFSRHKARVESGPSTSKSVVRESTTVVDSNETPAVGPESHALELAMRSSAEASNANLRCRTMSGGGGGGGAAGTSTSGGVGGKEVMTCEMTVTSSPGGSSASAELLPALRPPAEDRKRKGREVDDTECQSEDVDFESADAKKRERGTSTKRSRAAEVHNLSERRRRDRINEKMKALQELIPRCNKSDKASMLDEAIEYLKSLQLQVQMMSMGCGMVPMMFPGVQQYMPPMGMGIGMSLGMGMGMEMGMNRPIMPFPNVLTGSALTTPAAAAHLGPRFPMPAFHIPPVPPTDPSRIQPTNQPNQMLNTLGTPNPNQSQIPNFPDPYQQYFGQHQMQFPLHQNQAMVQPSTNKLSTSRGPEIPENHQSG